MSDELDITAALVRASALVSDICARAAADHGVTVQQAQLLCVISDRPATMAQISTLLRITKSSATGIIDRAEEAGLVHREADPDDRRLHCVRLSEHGDRVGASYRQAVTRSVGALLDGIPFTTAEALRGVLSEIVLSNQARLTWPESTPKTSASV